MAINIHFNGATILKPGFYGDPSPRARWWNHSHRRDFLNLLRKLGVRSASLYGL